MRCIGLYDLFALSRLDPQVTVTKSCNNTDENKCLCDCGMIGKDCQSKLSCQYCLCSGTGSEYGHLLTKAIPLLYSECIVHESLHRNDNSWNCGKICAELSLEVN